MRRSALLCAITVTAALGVLSTHAAQAQAEAAAVRPCRASFDETTSGGDVMTQRGEIRFDRSMPQSDGSFIMSGSGTSTVNYTAVGSCQVLSGSPFTAQMMGILVSDDGAFVEIDITPVDAEPDHVPVRPRHGRDQCRHRRPAHGTVAVAARRERPLHRGRAPRRFDLRHRDARALRRRPRLARADRG
ncbi:MAG TPA: hypothetical protein VFX89_03415 [Gammaproteobacteria bacterium]|nr:hypothetical protein [Gammaproteobacteria bacterium]